MVRFLINKAGLVKLPSRAAFVPLLFFMLSLLSACNSVDGNSKTTQPDWSVTLTYSGGFAGLMRSITVDHSGLAVFHDKKTPAADPRKLATVSVSRRATHSFWQPHRSGCQRSTSRTPKNPIILAFRLGVNSCQTVANRIEAPGCGGRASPAKPLQVAADWCRERG